MKRLILVLLSVWFVGIVFAHNQSEYPTISPENVMNLQEVEVLGNGQMNDAIAWSEDGQLAIGAKQGIYLYRDVNTEAEFIELGLNVQSLLFAGETVFFTDDTSLFAYDLANQQILYSLEGQKPLAISEDARMLAYEVEMGVRVLEISSGEMLYNLDYDGLLEDEAGPEDDWFSENRFLAAQFFAGDSQLYVKWMHIYAGGWEGRSNWGDDIWTLADQSHYSPNEFFDLPRGDLVYGVDGTDTAILLPIMENLPDNSFSNTTFEFETNYVIEGDYLAGSYRYSEDRSTSVAVTGIWNWRTGEEIARIPLRGIMQFSPDASMIAIDRQVFDVVSGEELRAFKTDTYEFFGGNLLHYGADDSLRLLSVDTLEEIAILPFSQSELGGVVGQILIHQDRQSALLIDAETGQVQGRFESNSRIFGYWERWQFNTNQTFAMSYYDGLTYLWNVQTGENALPADYRILEGVFVDGSGVLVKTSTTVGLYNPETERFIWTFDYRCDCSVDKVWFDEDYLIVFGGGSASIYDFQTQENLFYLRIANPDFVDWDGETIAYIAENDEIRVVSLPEGEVILRIPNTAFGYVFLYSESIVVFEEEWTYERFYYDIETGQEIDAPAPLVLEPQPVFQSSNLAIFRENTGLRIEAENAVVHQLVLETYSELRMSRNENLLLIEYGDGRVGVWAVGE